MQTNWDVLITAAKKLGIEHANNAASWACDGNSDVRERRKVLAMLRDGDPAAYDYLPRKPNLSGKFADDPTPESIYHTVQRQTVLRESISDTERSDSFVSDLQDALASAYEEAVSETFSLACERELMWRV